MDEDPALKRLARAQPRTLGTATSGDGFGVETDQAGQCWRVRWTGAGLQTAEVPFAAAPAGSGERTGSAKLRSGIRIPGQPPRFPSSPLVISRAGSSVETDWGLVDESPAAEILASALTESERGCLAAYVARQPDGLIEARCALFPAALVTPESAAWNPLPDFPLAPGRAGLLAGRHGEVLIAGGGAYFPDRPPWEGGVKRYEADLHVLLPGAPSWQAAGTLPDSRGYGAVISLPDSEGVLVVGGESADQIFADCLLLRWNGQGVQVEATAFPPLPFPVTSPAAALVDGFIYVAGGYVPGSPRLSRHDFLRLRLHPGGGLARVWETLSSWPGPSRAMAVAAALDGAFYVISGLEVAAGGAAPVYLRDAYRYDPRTAAWTRLPDLPWSALAAPSPAPTVSAPPRFFILGGVDGTQVGQLPRETPLPNDILSFDPALNQWRLWPEAWPTPVVTTPALPVGAAEWAVISGELLPGRRTTAGWRWRPSP